MRSHLKNHAARAAVRTVGRCFLDSSLHQLHIHTRSLQSRITVEIAATAHPCFAGALPLSKDSFINPPHMKRTLICKESSHNLWTILLLAMSDILATASMLDQSPFAFQIPANEIVPFPFKPLAPIYRYDYLFGASQVLGPFECKESSESGRYMVISLSILQQTNLTQSTVRCRYDALMFYANNLQSFWWEPLQQSLPMRDVDEQVFENTVLTGNCGAMVGRNVLAISTGFSSYFATQLLVLNLPINDTAEACNTSLLSFALPTNAVFVWYPLTFLWSGIPVSWWKYLTAPFVAGPYPAWMLMTTWCSSGGFLLLPQRTEHADVFSANSTLNRVYVVSFAPSLGSDGTNWIATPILATMLTVFPPMPITQLADTTSALSYLTCHGNDAVDAELYFLAPGSLTLWRLDVEFGWIQLNSDFGQTYSYLSLVPPPFFIRQPLSASPILCWSAEGCTVVQVPAVSKPYNASISRLSVYSFNVYFSYQLTWVLNSDSSTLYGLLQNGELSAIHNFLSDTTATTMDTCFPRLNYADGLSFMMIDGTLANTLDLIDTALTGGNALIVNLYDQVYLYVCAVLMSTVLCDASSDLDSRVVVLQFDLTFQTMNLLTLATSPANTFPPLADNQFHDSMTVDAALMNYYSQLAVPFQILEGLEVEALIYSVSQEGIHLSDFLITAVAPIWMFLPTYRQFYLIGHLNFSVYDDIPYRSISHIRFSGGLKANQIYCMINYNTNAHVITSKLLLGNATANGITWHVPWPCSSVNISVPPAPYAAFVFLQEFIALPLLGLLAQVVLTATEPALASPFTYSFTSVACRLSPSPSCAEQCSQISLNLEFPFNSVPTLIPLKNSIVIVAYLESTNLLKPAGFVLVDILSGVTQQVAVASSFEFSPATAAYIPLINKILITEQNVFRGMRQTVAVSLRCPAGYFASTNFLPAPELDLCTICPIGSWNDAIGATSCFSCESPLSTSAAGSTSAADCNVCPNSYCHSNGLCILAKASAVCQCNFGYSVADRCAVPWLLLFTVLIVVVTVAVLLGADRYRKFKRRQKSDQARLLTEIEQLKQAWNISWTALESLELVAAGGFGSVYSAVWCGRQVAVKVMHDCESGAISPEFEREARTLRQYRHPHIVLFFGAGVNHQEQQFLVTEFVPLGSLRDVLDSHEHRTQLNWLLRLNMCLDIANGMDFLHRQEPPVIHRDIKSPNILVTAAFRCKIGDLGTARLIEISDDEKERRSFGKYWPRLLKRRNRTASLMSRHELVESRESLLEMGGQRQLEMMSRRVGTTKWAAPEMLLGAENYGLPVDIYACGIVYWEVMTEQLPFENMIWSWQVAEEVVHGKRPEWLEQHHARDQPAFMVLVEDCWAMEARARPTASMVLERLTVL